jgi:hypothetical protein
MRSGGNKGDLGLNRSAMMSKENIEEEIKILEFDTCSAQRYAREGVIENWVHRYLMSGKWANPGFSDGLKLQRRWWNGPIELELTALTPAVGTEPGMEYQVEPDNWFYRTSKLAGSMTDPLSIPPLIAEYRSGELSVRDGNTRYGAMRLLGWAKCWAIIWYNTESDYHQHSSTLFGS